MNDSKTHVDDPGLKAQRSADRVQPLFEVFLRMEYGTESEEIASEDRRASLGDIIADLMHLADVEGFDAAERVRSAQSNYESEVADASAAVQYESVLTRIEDGWPGVAGDLRDGVDVQVVTDRVVDSMDESEEKALLPLLHELAGD